MKITKEERIIRLIRKEEINYLPSKLTFSPKTDPNKMLVLAV